MKKTIFSILASLFLFTPMALAAEGGIQISPLTYNFDIKPGESRDGIINITNQNSENLDFTVEVELFSQVTSDGAPSFTGVQKVEGVTNLVDWISFPSEDREGIIPPQGKKEINFTISIPQNAEPGGHYAAIFAKQIKKTQEGKTELGVSSRVGTVMLISIPGEVKRDAELVKFSYPKFAWKGPVKFGAQVKNTGTIHYDSQAKVVIDPLFGSNKEIDLGTHTIIPKNLRDYSAEWNNKYPFGYYKLTATAKDGSGKDINASGSLLAIPLLIVLPSLAILITLLLIINYVKKNYKISAKKVKK